MHQTYLMKVLLILIVSFILLPSSVWLTNFKNAEKIAVEKHQLILLNFSGSDWCGPCIRLKKEFFQSSTFNEYADINLVLVNADFPRSNKNKLSKDQVKENEALADKYNSKGKFPLSLLLNEKGIVLKEWEGLPTTSPQQFVQEIKILHDSNK